MAGTPKKPKSPATSPLRKIAEDRLNVVQTVRKVETPVRKTLRAAGELLGQKGWGDGPPYVARQAADLIAPYPKRKKPKK